VTYARDHLIPLVDEGLGNSAYLADLGDGRALAADDGATVLAAAAGCRAFPHTALADGDEVDLGGLKLRALATPGHTDEHLSYLLLDGVRELGVFTGGSLIVGSAARTDLLGAGRAGGLARAQYRSLRRLAELPDATAVWPTHGAGSFCSVPPGAARVTTIGAEKAANPLLGRTGRGRLRPPPAGQPRLLPGLLRPARRGQPPRAWVAHRRREAGPADPGRAPLPGGPGRWVIDVRPVADFAAGHIPGRCPSRCAISSLPGWAGCAG
jgi:hydroxyacylglutathione hydrolase